MKFYAFLQLLCYFFMTLVVCSCGESYVFELDEPIKDLGAHQKLIKAFNAGEITGDDPYLTHTVVFEEGGAYVKKASIYGARCKIDAFVNFTVTVLDFNSNHIFDKEDQIILAGNSEDSVLMNHNPLKVVGKNPVYLRYQEQTIKLTLDESLNTVEVKLNAAVDYHDLVYPYTIPAIKVQDLVSNDSLFLPHLVEHGKPTLLIRSTPSCKPCLLSFEKYISSVERSPDSTLNINKIFFFPEKTDLSHIIKYTRLVKPEHNFKFVRGKLADLEETYGLIVLPDGVLFDENGRFSKNHFTLSNL